MKRHLPPLKSLLVFESVVRTGSVTSAAGELAVTHSAVSKQLSLLEEWLGVPLFAEKRRGMTPTSASARLADAAQLAFGQLQDAINEIVPDTAPAPVPIRLIAPATFAMRWLIPRLPDFQAPNRLIDITVQPTHTPENWLDIPFDVAIRRGGLIPMQFRATPLFKEELSLVMCAELARSVVTDRDDLADQLHTIGFVEATTRPGELRAWIVNAELPESLTDRTFRFPHFYVAMEAMLSGKGALVAPTLLIEDLLARGDVIEPWPSFRMPGPVYSVMTDPNSPVADEAGAFVTWLTGLTTRTTDEENTAGSARREYVISKNGNHAANRVGPI